MARNIGRNGNPLPHMDDAKEVSISKDDLKEEVEFLFPEVGESHKIQMEHGLHMDLLGRGSKDLLRFQESLNSHLTQPMFDLIRTDNLTPESLANANKRWSYKSDEKYWFLNRRYHANCDNQVIDSRKGNKILCSPNNIFDMIVCSHLINNHMTCRHVHRNLFRRFANISRDMVNAALKYCSVCNPNEEIRPLEKNKHKNSYKGLMPMERIHIEVFQVFEGKKIENKYTHILYFRDYHSRFVWLFPLKKLSFKHMVNVTSTFLLTTVRLPIYLESSTIERKDLFDMIGIIAVKYDMKLGLGSGNSDKFHVSGINSVIQLLENNKDECLKDWNMCLKFGQNFHNNKYNIKCMGIPIDLLYHEIHNSGFQYRVKQEKTFDETFAQNVVLLNDDRGVIYIEDREYSDPIIDEELEEPGDEYRENQFVELETNRSSKRGSNDEISIHSKRASR